MGEPVVVVVGATATKCSFRRAIAFHALSAVIGWVVNRFHLTWCAVHSLTVAVHVAETIAVIRPGTARNRTMSECAFLAHFAQTSSDNTPHAGPAIASPPHHDSLLCEGTSGDGWLNDDLFDQSDDDGPAAATSEAFPTGP